MKNRAPSTSEIERWIAQGYGQGRLASFKPLLYVRDIASRGRSPMVYCSKTDRVHHYASDLEYDMHFLCAHQPTTWDIRERFAALPWDETQQIARMLGVSHPTYKKSHTPKLLSTSFVISQRRPDGSEEVAVSLVSSEALGGSSASEARAIAEILSVYWKYRGIRHLVVPGLNLPRVKAKNLARFYSGVVNPSPENHAVTVDECVDCLCRIFDPIEPKNMLMLRVSDVLAIPVEVAEALLGRAVWERKIDLNLDTQISHTLPLPLRRSNMR